MVFGDINPQEFGELKGDVKSLLANQAIIHGQLIAYEKNLQANLNEHNRILFAKIDNLTANGCAVGVLHERVVMELRIKLKELEDRPAKIIGLGAVIIAILSTIGGFFYWLHGKL